MVIERTDKEIIIKVSSNIDIEGLEEIVDLIKYRETLAKSQVSDSEIEQLAEELNDGWWKAKGNDKVS